MRRDHFLKLAPPLHFENNLAVSAEAKASYKVWKLEPWLSDFWRDLGRIPEEKHNCIDEVMVSFMGKSAINQYERVKPYPYGFKLWARTGKSGILQDFRAYHVSADGKR